MKKKINDICNIISEKINSDLLNNNNYISTENMLPNFQGICSATSLPKGNVTSFKVDDILLSNIRPYFKKIWFSKFNGGCSNDVIVLRANNNIIINKYLYYSLSNNSFINYYVSSCKGTKMPRGNKDALLDWQINVPPINEQQHIVNTIGSIDDLIENYNNQYDLLLKIGLNKINYLNNKSEHIKLIDICRFDKGCEVGSKNYTNENNTESIKYLRVGDLQNLQSTFINKSLTNKLAKDDDILIAFDGAPGRNNIGLNGAYSSGIYKAISDDEQKGIIFFELNSTLNQKVISNLAQGTTILHAAKSINHLECIKYNEKESLYFNKIFIQLVNIKRKVNLLQLQKDLLLNKYFTNQQ